MLPMIPPYRRWRLLACLAALASCQPATSPPTRMTATPAAAPAPEKFTLSAGPCAAKGYPMTIELGNFRGPDGSSFPVPSGHYLEGKWGVSSRAWAVGDEIQPVPERLEILYFSYAEDRFYEGTFALPTEAMRAQLRAGFWDLDDKQAATYNELTVCALPRGLVVVWLTGAGKQVLVGHFLGHESGANFAQYYPAADRAAMLREELATLPPAVQAQAAAGTISARPWMEDLKAYPWQLAFSQPLKLVQYSAGFLNGEYTSYPLTPDLKPYLEQLLQPAPKAVPQRLALQVTDVAGHRYMLRAEPLDEAETRAAFQALHQAQPASPITLLVETDKYLKKATLVLLNDAQRIPLPKSPVRIVEVD